MRKRHRLVTALTALAALGAATSAAAAQVQVRMLNHGPDGMMVFEPAFVVIQPGDTVKFIAADKGHNAASLPGMVPAGAAGFTASDQPGDRGQVHEAGPLWLPLHSPHRPWHGRPHRGRQCLEQSRRDRSCSEKLRGLPRAAWRSCSAG